ncbi:2-succinyl-5-enolpyruvyl-6-hydroxy-3-cyclohexene-1-carboxylic-acid synthase [Halobacteriovorax sp.]|uniref:2-succinyl-5-enolpyruvyl-6-hydroxy-3- cyclohexene-1-carboxylic-acid synthase n=1 Tax=Halobacteriovorax sp. TaxID=2020862 RepID=UPI003569F73E
MLLTNNLSVMWSSIIIDELIKSGVIDFYISPGMRNAPLVQSLLQRNEVNLYLGIDERGQSYRALGNAKATGRTSALLCTSGTALANYTPAIIEAKKSATPLIVLSADRPIELATSDANQTINQVHFYGNHVLADNCLGAPTEEICPQVIRNTLDHLIFRSRYPIKGPVHLNIPLREPLDMTEVHIAPKYIEKAEQGFKKQYQTKYFPPTQGISPTAKNVIADIISNNPKGLLVVGSLPCSLDKVAIKEFIEKLNWPVFLDISSSLKYSYSIEDNIIPTFDHSEVYEKLSVERPTTIIHLGGRTTSKHYYRFLEEFEDINLITVNWSEEKEDPSQNTDFRIISEVDQFCQEMSTVITPSKTPININWKEFSSKKCTLIDEANLSYPYISKKIIDNIQNSQALYIANSTVVRSFDNYLSLESKKEIDIFTNRGVSGIEGLMASAIGCAESIDKYTTLVIGDVSFLHDLNSLQIVKESKAPLCIILVNNSGGGIFTLLPIANNKELLPYLTTPHSLTFENAAKLFDIKYKQISTTEEFDRGFVEAQTNKESIILEVIVDNDTNKDLYNKLKTVKL